MKRFQVTIALVGLLCLTGCWDQRLLKDNHLILCAGIDQLENGKVQLSIASHTGISDDKGVILTGIGNTVRNARVAIDYKTEKTADNSKIQMILLSERIARQTLFDPINISYRDRNSTLTAKIAIVKGSPMELMEASAKKDPLVGPYLSGLIVSEEKELITDIEDLGSIGDKITKPGMDPILPVLNLIDMEPAIIGSATVHDDKMTGILSIDDTRLILLFTRANPKSAKITIKVLENQDNPINNYMTLGILDVKSKINVAVTNKQKIIANLNTELTVNVQEFKQSAEFTEESIARWNQKISRLLSYQADQAILKLQHFNCDVYGIGDRIRAYYPDLWKKINWDKEYANVEFHPSVKVNIYHTGAIQ